MGCEAIVDCKLLIRLLNLLDPSLHLNEQMNTEDRLNTFVRSLRDQSMQFKLLAQECCTITDLQTWNKGLPAEQVARQQRIVKCLVKLGHAVNEINVNGKDYMGPRMDEATLGHHGANEFFSELAILPLEGGWKHRRTVVAMRNSMLYMLSRRAVDHIAINYSELKFQLADHAEDWDKTEKLNSSLTMINSDMGPSSKRDKTFRSQAKQ